MKRIGRQGLIFVFFVTLYSSFANFANGLMYFGIFISNFSRKKYVNYSTVFLISIFWDIYSFAFIGISSILLATFYFLSSRFSPVFQHFKLNMGYLFLFLCCTKLFSFILINFLGYHYDVFSHWTQIFWAMLVYAAYYFLKTIYESVYYA
jgi:cell shape-determining protein MreD